MHWAAISKSFKHLKKADRREQAGPLSVCHSAMLQLTNTAPRLNTILFSVLANVEEWIFSALLGPSAFVFFFPFTDKTWLQFCYVVNLGSTLSILHQGCLGIQAVVNGCWYPPNLDHPSGKNADLLQDWHFGGNFTNSHPQCRAASVQEMN